MRAAAVVLPLFMAAACAPRSAAPAAPAPPPPPPRTVQSVTSTVLTNGCEALGMANAKLAEAAMYQLVEGCSSVPGGTAQFSATLLPGGRIEIASVAGQPDVVPTCILKHSLLHRVALAKPCRLEFKIEEKSLPVPVDAGARD